MSEIHVGTPVFANFLAKLVSLIDSSVTLHNSLLSQGIAQEEDEIAIEGDVFSDFNEKFCDLHMEMNQIGASLPAYESILYSQLDESLKSEIDSLTNKLSSQEITLSQVSKKQRSLEAEFGVFTKNRSVVDNSLVTDLPSNYEKMEFLLVQYRERIIQLAEVNERLRMNHTNEVESMRSAHMIDRREHTLLLEGRFMSQVERLRKCIDDIGVMTCSNHVPGKLKTEEAGDVVEAVRVVLARDREELNHLTEEIREMDKRLTCLRGSLEDAELVQRDFVLLTQRLQIENNQLKDHLKKYVD